jgi:hypothetical protein
MIATVKAIAAGAESTAKISAPRNVILFIGLTVDVFLVLQLNPPFLEFLTSFFFIMGSHFTSNK